jgi:putative CocE/NonD family hydrolase
MRRTMSFLRRHLRQHVRAVGIARSAGLAALAVASLGAVAQADKVSRLGEYSGYSPALYAEQQRQSIYLPMRDGTRLAVDIHRPGIDGKAVDTRLPVVWQHALSRRAPTDTATTSITRMVPQLVKYGYVVVEVERRGLGASFGARRAYNDRTEARDAYEVTEWLARQPWSTGKVGVIGCSNTGDAAMHAASYAPPSLKAVFAGCFSWSKYDGFLRGGLRAQWGVGPEQPLEVQLRNAAPVDGDDDRTLLRQAIEQHRDSTPLSSMWQSMPYRDSWSDIVASRFWLEGSVATHRAALQSTGAAFYIFGGWQDDFRREGLVAWANLARTNPTRVLIGPWLHCRHPGFDMLAEAHRFFDRWLKGVDNGIDREPPLHLYTVNAEPAKAWRAYTAWPPVDTTAQAHALVITRATDPAADQSLAEGGQPGAARIALPVRTATPCPEAGSLTQPCPQAAGLRFTGPVLKADTTVSGHPLAKLWIASPQPDQNVFLYLEDVAPDGSVSIVSEGRLKASLRALHKPPYEYLGLPWQRSLEADHQPLQAGEPVALQFDLLPLAHVFKAGHRVRVVITGNDPRERPSAPTGHLLTVFSDARHPSTLTLPVVSASAGARRP